MSPLLWHTRVLYGVAAMSASVIVFTFLQEREEQEGRELLAAEQLISSAQFFQAMESLRLTTQQKIEMRKFWHNLCKRVARDQREEAAGADGTPTDDPPPVESIPVWEIQHVAREYKQVFPDIFPADEVLEATRLAAEAGLQWNGIVGSTSSMIRSTGKRFQDIANDTKIEMQGAVHRTMRKYLERSLDVVADRLKHSLKDRHMPMYLKTNIDSAVDQFMPDVKVEIFRKTRDLFAQEAPPRELPKLKQTAVTSKKVGC
jgi:hypothetical protein